jgi:membrane protein
MIDGTMGLVWIVERWDRTRESARRRSELVDHLWLAKERMEEVLASRLAAAISYYGFFAAFSLAVVAYSVIGRVLGYEGGFVDEINDYLSTTLPWVVETANQVGRSEVAIAGMVALVLTGVGWVEALRSSQRAVWLLDQHPGNWIVRRLVDLGMLVGLGALLALSLGVSAALDRVIDWLAPDTTLGNSLLRLSGPVLEFGVNLLLAAATLTALPRLRLSLRRLLPPALVIAVGIQLLNTVGRLFIVRTEARPAYQLVAGAVGLLVYLYLINQLLLWGAALAATARHGTVLDLGSRSPAGETESGSVGEPSGDMPAEPR